MKNEMKNLDEAYLKGWHDCMDLYAHVRLGERFIGMFNTPLDVAKKGAVKCAMYHPPSENK